MQYRFLHITLPFFSIAFIGTYFFWKQPYVNTRKQFSAQRRLNQSGKTSIAKKNLYFKEAINASESVDFNIGTIALKMNDLEAKYNIPYKWGGSIKNYSEGLDCSGFIHGMMYYLGEPDFHKRFNTYTLYRKLLNHRDYKLVYTSQNHGQYLDYSNLMLGDIILWPSGVDDGKNLAGEIIGHIGVVSLKQNEKFYVTNYVDSPRYNNADVVGSVGAGINTMDAESFIKSKKRGVLYIFRKSKTTNDEN